MKCVPENALAIPISFLLHKYCLNHGSIRCLLNHLDWVDTGQCDLDQGEFSRNIFIPIQNWVGVIPIYRKFLPTFSTSVFFALSIFEYVVTSEVFHCVLTFTFRCVVPRQALSDQVKYVAVSQHGLGNLWVCDSNGYWWVNSNFVIHAPPKINTHSVTTFSTPKGEVPVRVSLSINKSAQLISFCNEHVSQLHTPYC